MSNGNTPLDRYDKSITQRFKDLLKIAKIDEEELKKLDLKFFKANKKELAKIYKEIGNPNEFSMAVFSGPNPFTQKHKLSFDRIQIGSIFHNCYCPFGRRRCRHDYCPYYDECRCLRTGCLYLGDIDLSEKNEDESKLLRKIYETIPSKSLEDLSTIQVPHHGSIDNFNPSLLSCYEMSTHVWKNWDCCMLYVISVGESNTYGHPSAWVLKDLLRGKNLVTLVSEASTSILIEKTNFE